MFTGFFSLNSTTHKRIQSTCSWPVPICVCTCYWLLPTYTPICVCTGTKAPVNDQYLYGYVLVQALNCICFNEIYYQLLTIEINVILHGDSCTKNTQTFHDHLLHLSTCVRTQDLSMIWQCSTNGLILFRRGSEIIYSKEVINNPTSLTHSSIKYTVLIIPWMPTPEKFLT